MGRPERLSSVLNTTAAVVVSIVLLLLPPASYGIVAYLSLTAEMARAVDHAGSTVNQAIASAPQLWAFQEVRLTEILSREQYRLGRGRLMIFDDRGEPVVAVGEPPAWPVITRAAILYDAGTPVGRLEQQNSLRDVLFKIGWLFLVGFGLAAMAFVTLRVVPLRALQRANAVLRQRDLELNFANTVLTAAREESPDGMLVVDPQGRIILTSRRFLDMWEIPPELVAGGLDEPLLAAVTARTKDPEAFRARVLHFYKHPELSGRDRIELKNGRVFERHTNALRDPAGRHLGRIWFFRDMTERERLEEELRNSEEKFRNLVESTTDFIWETDTEGRFIYVSPAIETLLGYRPEEVIGRAVYDFMQPADAARIRDLFIPIVGGKRPFSAMENTVRRKDGSAAVIETSGVPVLDKSGALRGYRGIDREITDRKLAEAALQRRDILLHAIAISTTELAATSSLDEVMAEVMGRIAAATAVDRISIVEQPRVPSGMPVRQYIWVSPDAGAEAAGQLFTPALMETPEVTGWLARLHEGQPVAAEAQTTAGRVREALDAIGLKSLLLVPIAVDGKFWGHVGFGNCRAERRWERFETELLRTLGDTIGSAVQRERYIRELRDAMRIVHDTPTILYRLSSGPSMAVSYVSQNVKLFGYNPEAFINSPHLLMTIVHPDDVARLREALSLTADAGGHPGMIEHRILTSQGSYRWVENRYTPVSDANGRLVEIEGILVDITDRKAAEEKIALLARTDPLTGLANRATFVDRLRLAYAAARRGALPFAVHYIDLDRFKDINDSLGHPAGDELLKVAAERMRRHVRDIDLVARPGGDEFAILQIDLGDGADAGALAAKIRAGLAEPIQIGSNQLHVTASIGIAVYTPEIGSADDMLARADLALYRAKEEGRNQYRFHSEDLDDRVREQVTVAEELRGAIDRGEFEIWYQPQVELATGRIVGMEALLRWNHPVRGRLAPLEFIPIAEKTGTMGEIGRWVFDRACGQMNAWREAGIAPQSIAMNASLTELKTAAEYVEFVAGTLEKWGLAGSDVEIDVTESMLAYTTLGHNDVLERLRALGIRLAIDDFGTKYSSLDYLRSYHVSRIKIPQEMVAGATHDAGDAAMIRAIAGIARELKVEVVAQGVETETQWSFLSATSAAAEVQGHFYSLPVSAREATELLRRGAIGPAADRRTASG